MNDALGQKEGKTSKLLDVNTVIIWMINQMYFNNKHAEVTSDAANRLEENSIRKNGR